MSGIGRNVPRTPEPAQVFASRKELVMPYDVRRLAMLVYGFQDPEGPVTAWIVSSDDYVVLRPKLSARFVVALPRVRPGSNRSIRGTIAERLRNRATMNQPGSRRDDKDLPCIDTTESRSPSS